MDVFIFQMGKVGSSALTEALCNAGVNATQTHWLDKETLIGSLESSLLNVELDEATAFRGIEEFNQNILNIRRLLWYQRNKRHNGRKLKIISLARDPLDWYWGHLAENFDLYRREITDWYRQVTGRPDTEIDLPEAVAVFHEALFAHFGAIRRRIEHPRFDRHAAKQRYYGVYVPFLPQQIMKLRLPTVWFDVFFRPATGIDIYRQAFDLSSGIGWYENDYAELMLIRYEDLAAAIEPLKGFLELSELPLKRINLTSDKATDFDIKAFARDFRPHPRAIAKLYASPYCRFFGYTPDAP